MFVTALCIGIVHRHWAAGNGRPIATEGTAAAANEERQRKGDSEATACDGRKRLKMAEGGRHEAAGGLLESCRDIKALLSNQPTKDLYSRVFSEIDLLQYSDFAYCLNNYRI